MTAPGTSTNNRLAEESRPARDKNLHALFKVLRYLMMKESTLTVRLSRFRQLATLASTARRALESRLILNTPGKILVRTGLQTT